MGRTDARTQHRRRPDIIDRVRMVDPNVSYATVHASRGKVMRAEPVGIVARSSLSKKIRRPNRARQVCKDSPLEGWREVDSNFRFRAAG